jgi:hypothetical protein
MSNQKIDENLIFDSELMDDKKQPVLYNPLFVMGYGVVLSVFAGSILMAMNFHRLNQKEKSWKVVGLGLAYTVLQIFILGQLQTKRKKLTIPASFLSMYLIDILLWSANVPNGLNYKKRSVLWPILVAILISITLILIVIVSQNS